MNLPDPQFCSETKGKTSPVQTLGYWVGLCQPTETQSPREVNVKIHATLTSYYRCKCTNQCEHHPPPRGPEQSSSCTALPAFPSKSGLRCSNPSSLLRALQGLGPGPTHAGWDLPRGPHPNGAAPGQLPAVVPRGGLAGERITGIRREARDERPSLHPSPSRNTWNQFIFSASGKQACYGL